MFVMVMVVVVVRTNDPNALWSPYYYITVGEECSKAGFINERSPALSSPHVGIRTMQDPPAYNISVNHDFYQPHRTLNPARFSAARLPFVESERVSYDLPYALSPAHRRELVLGAGGGTDTEVAVLNGAEHVDAVEIDPMLVSLSKRFNPSGIYKNPKVTGHIDDARAYLRRAQGGYDMVLFGWLDSQALFSSMSNLRLDGSIYTVESVRAAWNLLNAQGTLSLSFMAGMTGWLGN